jgi:type IV pilus assembly protein PilE
MRQVSKIREFASAELKAGIRLRPGRLRSARGFTLIELMIVVTIVAVLAAIAIPAYNNSVMKSNRATAKTALLDLAAREEKWYSLTNSYSSTPSELYGSGTTITFPMNAPLSGQALYQIKFNSTYPITTASGSTPATYAIEAVPISGGPQASDPCGTFYLNSAGQQSVSGSGSCW